MTQGVAGALELSGTAGTLLLLVPFALLAVVVWRTVRSHAHAERREGSAAERVAAVAALPIEVPLDERIAAARARGDEAALAELYLLKAREASAAGDSSGAISLLRDSVGHAQRTGNAAAHADARLDLAEIAREAGDLTTACEHWQMARRLFHDLARKDRLAEADALMIRHGCPTDWVLTDF